MWRYFLPLGIFLVLIVYFAIGLTLDPHKVPSPLIGKPAPAFRLPTVADPNQFLATADLKGRPILINVWASWCTACREEHPLLLRISKDKRVAIYGLDYKDTRIDANAWLTQGGDPYRLSAFDADGRAAIDWGVYGVPETFLVDAAGIIRYKHIGPLTEAVFAREILPLLGVAPPCGLLRASVRPELVEGCVP
jgi:cytochrome c biogenesis protein CcmG/thiol:disulfide interchange protein DsbE